jgi:branched-chain amino acid transport system permease protein
MRPAEFSLHFLFASFSRWRSAALYVLLVALVIAAPAVGNSYYTSVLFLLLIAICITVTYDIVAGYMGYFNLGHGAFFGIGAYVYGITIAHGGNGVLATILAVVGAVIFAAVISYPLFRLRGAYFAIATFGVLKLMEVLALNLRDLTGGTTGLSISPTDSAVVTYYLAASLCAVAIMLNAWIANSRLGLALLAIREDEEVSEASGINTTFIKCAVLVLSAALPGFAGALYMWHITYIDPASAFGATAALAPVIMAVLGGSGTVIGPVIGAIFLTIIGEALWSHVGYLQLAMYGVVLVVVGIFVPGGLIRSRIFSRAYGLLGFSDHYGFHVSKYSARSTTQAREK